VRRLGESKPFRSGAIGTWQIALASNHHRPILRALKTCNKPLGGAMDLAPEDVTMFQYFAPQRVISEFDYKKNRRFLTPAWTTCDVE